MNLLQHSSLRPKGTLHITYADGKETVYETMCCVHCRKHWRIEPGSGKRRGYCHRCGGPTCGAHECDMCVPFEAKLEAEEAAADRFVRDVGGIFLPGLTISG